jgi:hypothetical protein
VKPGKPGRKCWNPLKKINRSFTAFASPIAYTGDGAMNLNPADTIRHSSIGIDWLNIEQALIFELYEDDNEGIAKKMIISKESEIYKSPVLLIESGYKSRKIQFKEELLKCVRLILNY